MRFAELFKLLKGHTDYATLAAIVQDFRQDVIETAGSSKHNNTTRKAAVNSYIKNAESTCKNVKQDIENGLFCDGVSALNIPTKGANYDPENLVVKTILDEFKTARPVSEFRGDIDYAVALAKCNGWRQGNKDHYIKVGEATYNLTLIKKIYDCIADPGHAYGVDLLQTTEKGSRAGLLMKSKYGIGFILPFNSSFSVGSYDVTPGAGFMAAVDAELDSELRKGAAECA